MIIVILYFVILICGEVFVLLIDWVLLLFECDLFLMGCVVGEVLSIGVVGEVVC